MQGKCDKASVFSRPCNALSLKSFRKFFLFGDGSFQVYCQIEWSLQVFQTMSCSPPQKVRKIDFKTVVVDSDNNGDEEVSQSEECSVDPSYSRHHCDICKKLTFALHALQCCECGLFLCQNCSGDFMITDDEAPYCSQGFLNDSDYHC